MNNVVAGNLIELKQVSKKFGKVWIFKDIDLAFKPDKCYAITGPNGSGKSTLLKIIAGIVTPNKGEVLCGLKDVWQEITYCAPYMELPEELTLPELLAFHGGLRKINIPASQFMEMMQIDPAKEIRHYSSGMKQRVKLALAFYTESKVLLLDEPGTTLDTGWMQWYLDTARKMMLNKLMIICSNVPEEYIFCDRVVNIADL